jgi:hypothetical protein
MEIKFKLDTNKAARAAVAIVASYGLGRVSEGTKYPQLAFANAIALIIIITILYSTRPAGQNHTSATCGTKAAGYMDAATASNTMGGSNADKGLNTRCI